MIRFLSLYYYLLCLSCLLCLSSCVEEKNKRIINRPQKLSDNPFKIGANVWDAEKNGVAFAEMRRQRLCLWLFCYDSTGMATGTTYQFSDDSGATWEKPKLGLVSYLGSTENNLCTRNQIVSMVRSITGDYLGIAAIWEDNIGVFVVSSPDGIYDWQLRKTLLVQNDSSASDYTEGNAIAARADGRLVAYGIRGHANEARSVVAWLSDSADIGGAWKYCGVAVSSGGPDCQRYTWSVFSLRDYLWALSSTYTKGTDRLQSVCLYKSISGLSWTLCDSSWIATGAPGEWDNACLFTAGPAIQIKNQATIFYSGAGKTHAEFPRGAKIGGVFMPWEKFGH